MQKIRKSENNDLFKNNDLKLGDGHTLHTLVYTLVVVYKRRMFMCVLVVRYLCPTPSLHTVSTYSKIVSKMSPQKNHSGMDKKKKDFSSDTKFEHSKMMVGVQSYYFIHSLILLIICFNEGLAQSDCKSRIEHHRTKYGVDPPFISERTDLHSCANRQSQFDKQMGAHKSYKRCGFTGSQGQGGGSTCANVIDAFFNERWRCTDTPVFGTPFAESNEGSQRKCRQACMNDEICLSYDFDSNATNNCRFYDVASMTHAKLINNNFWLGAPEYTGTTPTTVDGWRSFSLIETDGSKTIPAAGKITDIKYYGSNTNGVTFFIYRLVSGTTYQVVGKLQATSTIVDAENTITANPALAVQKGDVIGWTYEGDAAFGFTNSNQGQVLYKNGDESGGPIDLGDEWTFDRGPLGRRYHIAVSYVPDEAFTPSVARNYCAAALCQGHCGPVMDGNTKSFAWGVWNNFYTLNWRPGARIPSGENQCPSGIDVVKCWNDDSTGIMWAYGVGGEDCHSTCSLAGASPADYMCDEDTPITGGFDQVSSIMTNFENDYNSNDPDEFTCSKGGCWNGESNKQIMIHEYNSNCYIPTNSQKYSCDTRFGNANCYGQRFNQVCPCVPGCSWAAGPSCVSVILFMLVCSNILIQFLCRIYSSQWFENVALLSIILK